MAKIIISAIIIPLLILLIIKICRYINAKKYKICSNNGIEKTEYIAMGGIKQYIQIRGENILNPIIIMLHGGPGNNMAHYSYYWQKDLEKNYTIVHWDQRGCGNTYYQNKNAEKPTLELLLTDLDELIDYICLTYNKEKVIIVGHSWGTFLGAIYSGKNPQKVYSYIGISQMIDFRESEKISSEEAMRLACEKHKIKDKEKINKQFNEIMKCKVFNKGIAIKFLKLRQLKDKYLSSGNEMSLIKTIRICLLSPYTTFNNLKWMVSFNKFIESNAKLYKALLLDEKLSMYNFNMKYEIPVVIIAGECDWVTPYNMAQKYVNEISSPKKKFVTIPNVGHVPFINVHGGQLLMDILSKKGK